MSTRLLISDCSTVDMVELMIIKIQQYISQYEYSLFAMQVHSNWWIVVG